MCGIAGQIRFDRGPLGDDTVRGAMCTMQAHRGPDSEGIWSDHGVVLGQRRLAIIDVSDAGKQPMESWDGEFVVTFNGEIYNYKELRAQLADQGCRFRTHTDTEIILEAYRVWGSACVDRFIGMWAFAMVDRRQRQVFISRDRFGIKPFYYCHDDREFLFASEIKALLCVRPGLRRANEPYLARFLETGLLDDGSETCFDKVLQLPPAHSGTVDIDTGHLQIQRYWQHDARADDADSANNADLVSEFRALLESSVRLHMRSDVPVGMCLSGGVDSSALACLIRHLFGTSIHTFSGRYPDKDCDEGAYIDAVNRKAGTIAAPIYPEPRSDLVSDLQKITWHQDEPTAGPGLYTQYHVMKRASDSVTVVLDGQGADEMLGGYLSYFGPYLEGLRRRGRIRGRLQVLRKLVEMQRHWGWRQALRHLGLVVPMGPMLWCARRLGAMRDDSVPLLHPRLTKAPPPDAIQPFADPFSNLLYRQLTVDSLPALLHYEDRNSMAFSIEARVPYLDHRLVEFALKLPTTFKIHGTWTKWILREATADILPDCVAWRRSKLGYATPMDRWLRSSSERADVEEVLFSRQLAQRELMHPDAVARLWREQLRGHNHGWPLYRILTTELWYRQTIDALEMHPAVPTCRAPRRQAA